MVKRGNENIGTFFILVDEVRHVRFNDYGGSDIWPAGSATINIELTAGQVVRIENVSSTLIARTDSTGYIHSWFTGHLLYAL